MNYLIALILLSSLLSSFRASLCSSITNTPFVITFFIKPLDKTKRNLTDAQLLRKYQAPGKAVKAILKQHFNSNFSTEGILATYGGYLAFSDKNGQITLPKRTSSPNISILVSQAILPVPVGINITNTLQGFMADPKSRNQFFELTQQINKATNTVNWVTTEKPVPQKLISPFTIIILADPKDILIQEGISPALNGDNLILPNIYATKNLSPLAEVARSFKLRQFFRNLKQDYKFNKLSYEQKIK